MTESYVNLAVQRERERERWRLKGEKQGMHTRLPFRLSGTFSSHSSVIARMFPPGAHALSWIGYHSVFYTARSHIRGNTFLAGGKGNGNARNKIRVSFMLSLQLNHCCSFRIVLPCGP